MIQNVEDVIKWLDLNQNEWFTVSTTNDDNKKVFDSLEDETYESRKRRFRDTMQLCTGGRFVIKAKSNKTAGRGGFTEEFANITIGGSAPAVAGVTPVVSGITTDELERRITDALDRDRKARRLEELEAQLKEARAELKESDSAVNRILLRAEPIIGMIMNKMIPGTAQMGIAGTTQTIPVDGIVEQQNEVSEEEIDEMSTRIELAITKWGTADPDFIQVLEFIADFAAGGKEINAGFMTLTYPTVKGMMLKQ
jgi:hypothetical protein